MNILIEIIDNKDASVINFRKISFHASKNWYSRIGNIQELIK